MPAEPDLEGTAVSLKPGAGERCCVSPMDPGSCLLTSTPVVPALSHRGRGSSCGCAQGLCWEHQ